MFVLAPRPRRRARTGLAVAASLLLALSACTAEEPDEPAAEPAPPSLSDLDTTTLVVGRGAFCEAVDAEAVAAATAPSGAEETTATSWANGEPVTVGGAEDLAHENGCRWSAAAADPATAPAVEAAAWVFAPPVPAADAETYAAAAAATAGCTVLDGQPAYGTPTLALTCDLPADESGAAGREVSFRGLFGDAWLTCTLAERGTLPAADDLVERGSDWCAAVAVAASAS